MERASAAALTGIPEGARAYIGLSYGSIAVKWGPYEGPQVGEFMARLLEADPEQGMPFFVALDCGVAEDPVAEILAWYQDEPASAIEARSGETAKHGSTVGESAVPNGETPDA